VRAEMVHTEVQRPRYSLKGISFYFNIFSCWDGYIKE
jgi:hypothetical protein